MYSALVNVHSILRYVLLLLILISIVKSFNGWFGKKQYLPGDKRIALFTLISAHLQLIVGLGVYFMSAEVQFSNFSTSTKEVRFFTMEHITMMIIAIALITIGYSSSKKAATDEAKYKRVAIFFLLALIIILLAIPWPFNIWSGVTRGWMPDVE